jgi:hypothetical protein
LQLGELELYAALIPQLQTLDIPAQDPFADD